MLILVKMNGLRTYELVGVRLGPTKNAMMQQWHAGQYKVQGDTRLILIRHCLKTIRALWTIRLILLITLCRKITAKLILHLKCKRGSCGGNGGTVGDNRCCCGKNENEHEKCDSYICQFVQRFC